MLSKIVTKCQVKLCKYLTKKYTFLKRAKINNSKYLGFCQLLLVIFLLVDLALTKITQTYIVKNKNLHFRHRQRHSKVSEIRNHCRWFSVANIETLYSLLLSKTPLKCCWLVPYKAVTYRLPCLPNIYPSLIQATKGTSKRHSGTWDRHWINTSRYIIPKNHGTAKLVRQVKPRKNLVTHKTIQFSQLGRSNRQSIPQILTSVGNSERSMSDRQSADAPSDLIDSSNQIKLERLSSDSAPGIHPSLLGIKLLSSLLH